MRQAGTLFGTQADPLHQRCDPSLALGSGGGAVNQHRFFQDAGDGGAGVQRGEGVLEDHLHLSPQRA
jgi:hypothetical protein